MSQGEVGAVTELARGTIRAWWSSVAVLVALVLLPFALNGYRAPDIGAMASVIVSAVAALGYPVAIIVLMRRAWVLWRTRARFLGDRTDGSVFEFRGIVSLDHGDDDQRALLKAGVLRPDRGREQQFAVLPVSISVMHRDARGDWRTVTVRPRSVAEIPSYGMRAPVGAEIAIATDPRHTLVQRSLSPAEKGEIRHYVLEVKRAAPRLLLLLVYGSVTGMLLAGWIRSDAHRWIGLLAPAIGLYFFVRGVWSWTAAFRRAWLLARDAAAGLVFTLEPRARTEQDVGDVRCPGSAVREFLPCSGTVWTENGRPAAWRDLLT